VTERSATLDERPYVWCQGGTLVLEYVGPDEPVPACFRWIKGRWRCPAIHYAELRSWFARQGILNRVARWEHLTLTVHDEREPHDYQYEALHAWEDADRRGSIVLPTGAGKTFVAIRAIERLGRSTLVIAPTIDLLHQWYGRLSDAFRIDIGLFYGAEKVLQPITVTTYHSAANAIDSFGNRFALLVFDEAHHLPAPSWQEIALLSPAPYRLGLTATYPEAVSGDDSAPLVTLIGPIVYLKSVDDLTGQQLAEYRTERLLVDLTEEERARYEALHRIYAGYYREHRLLEQHGPSWWHEYTRRSAFDPEARSAKVAERAIKRIIQTAEAKVRLLDRLLKQHAHERVLVFTAHNALAYEISRRFLIPAITHQTKAAERKEILDRFRAGEYRAIVTSKVLNEGVDVPEAKVAIVLGGSASEREYIQRLGRILRKSGNSEALLYEVIVRDTIEESQSRRRQPKKRRVEYKV
jgi:superfamily II DNA or RNA helicase